jgi:uncharacterized membrane protein
LGFPFLIPFFTFGGGFGGVFTLLIVIAIANFLVRTIRNVGSNSEEMQSYNPTVSVGKIQVGLLASARDLQPELNDLAVKADTTTAEGRSLVLQETTLALLRHPEYWIYGATESQKGGLEKAEAQFNQLVLTERCKFSEETLSNVNNQLQQAQTPSLTSGKGELVPSTSGEYIIVTLVVGTTGQLKLPEINDSEDLRQGLQQMGSIGSDRLLAIEVLWTPQAEQDTLSQDDILAAYPNLKLV